MPRRPLLPLLTAACCLAAGLTALPTAAAADPQGPTLPAAPDFAGEVFADPWDFSNAEDLLLDEGPTAALQGARIRDGLLQFDLSGPGYLSPLWGGYPGGLYLGREGGAPHNRIDAGRFSRISFSAYASRTTAAGLMWFSCEGLEQRCMGGQPLELKAGWHTYDLALENSGYGLPQAWNGAMTGLRLAFSPGEHTSFAVDWMRVYAPTATTVPVPGHEVRYDVDDDPGDNTPDRPGWGVLPCAGSCDLSLLPPGSYTLLAGDTPTGSVVLRRPARPVLLDPDAVGGEDYATAHGDPWDMNGPGDVAEVGNATVLGYGGQLSAVNAPPVRNDPFAWLRLRSGAIDAGRYHRLTVTSGYEGPFNLDDKDGGGAHGRIVWQRADQGPGTVVQTKEWVTYSGTSRQTYDLDSPGIHEDDVGNRLPWGSVPVTGLRWDANEDRGARRWSLSRVALRADDEAGTSYAVRWYDAGFAPGSTVTLYRDDDAAGFDGRAISPPLQQRPGTNTYTWDSSATPPGAHWIYAEVTGPAGTGRAYSTGPVQVRGAGLAGQEPSPASPLTRDLGDACPQSRVPEDGFPDVPPGVHEAAVDCVAWWGVTKGTGSGFAPGAPVTRGQMATFLAEVVARTGRPLPEAPKDAFGDDDGSVHEPRINALAALGVVGGFADGTYRAHDPVRRDQMAAFLSRTYALRAGEELPVTADFFDDDGASTHQSAIDRVAGLGVTGGVAEGRFDPASGIRRAPMASFVARLLDALVAGGHGAPPAR